MIRYRYIPFTFGKPKFAGKEAAPKTNTWKSSHKSSTQIPSKLSNEILLMCTVLQYDHDISSRNLSVQDKIYVIVIIYVQTNNQLLIGYILNRRNDNNICARLC